MKNYKQIKPEEVYKNNKSYDQISFLKNLVFWVDNISSNKNAIFVRPFKQKKAKPQNLIGDRFLIKNVYHGYGGKSYQCFQNNGFIYLIWIDSLSKILWLQKFKENNQSNHLKGNYLISECHSKPLTAIEFGNFDSNFVILNHNILIGLLEKKDSDFLFKVDLDQENQKIKIIKKFDAFAGNLCSFSGNNILSWLEWDHQFMPWENNNLIIAYFDSQGNFLSQKKFEDKSKNIYGKISFFQPFWLSSDILVCSEDSSGWWNLIFLKIDKEGKILILKRIQKKYFEYGLPQWVSGLSIMSGSKKDFFCFAKNKNIWYLEHYQNFIFVKTIRLSFTHLTDLYSSSNNLILKGSNNVSFPQLIELNLNKYKSQKLSVHETNIKRFPKPESFWFDGFQNKPTHAWIYKPVNQIFQNPPLIVKAHGGPTDCFDGTLNQEVQFWSDRGWMVVEVNYGGSSGFGKEYIERLNGNWGILDSQDCLNIARILIDLKLVNESKIVILGNSAGGFTAINSLCENKIFKAAICKYPVLDLNEMVKNTHRFERQYLNSLIGDFNQNKELYFKRSPINKIEKIKKPVLFFHGKKDFVISFEQTLKMHKELIKKNLYSQIKLFDNEGHGFKNIKNKVEVLKASEAFLRKTFNY